jgi:DNA helicase II / ATP-dependent DNA helicase PcrA
MSEIEMVWSEQQAAFIEWARERDGSCVLEAVAGAGKTTTLLAAAEEMDGQVAIMAFNKKIAEEIKGKLQAKDVSWQKVQSGTVHSFGFKAYRKAYPNVQVREHKVISIIEEQVKEGHDLHPYLSQIVRLVSLGKQRALGVLGLIEDESKWYEIIEHYDLIDHEDDDVDPPLDRIVKAAQWTLKKSIAMTDVIDFDDMVFMPLVLKLPFWRFDVVMVDEAQDTNPARRAMVRAMIKRGGRVIAVGDRHQAIYGFTGADNDSLDRIAEDFNCVRLPLTTTYRCPKEVVKFAQQWVSHIEAAETAPEGRVSRSHVEEFLKRNDLDKNSAVLCRNTAPLLALAFRLIRQRVACKVEGRDIGEGLKKLARRWKVRSLDVLEARLDEFLERERTKLLAKKQEAKLAVLEDTVATLKEIMDQCRIEGKNDVEAVVAYIDQLFADDVRGVMVLSTIHKSKGREWPRVFWLDRKNTCPSRYARQKWQMDQEINLMYVAATRAQEELIDLAA